MSNCNPQHMGQRLLLVDENNYLVACAQARGEIRFLAHQLHWADDDIEQFCRERFLLGLHGLSLPELDSIRRYFEDKQKGIAR